MRFSVMLVVVLHFVVVSLFSFFWSSFRCCIFICRCFFVHIFIFDVIPNPSAGFLHPFYTFSPGHRRVIHETFIYSTFPFLLRALRPWGGIFYLQAFFTLHSFTDILTCVYQGFPGSWQFFLEVYRASYWSSKYRSGPSVCLMIPSNPQSLYSQRFSCTFYYILA